MGKETWVSTLTNCMNNTQLYNDDSTWNRKQSHRKYSYSKMTESESAFCMLFRPRWCVTWRLWGRGIFCISAVSGFVCWGCAEDSTLSGHRFNRWHVCAWPALWALENVLWVPVTTQPTTDWQAMSLTGHFSGLFTIWMPHMPQKGEDHRSNHITTKSQRKKKKEGEACSNGGTTGSGRRRRRRKRGSRSNQSINHTTLKTSNHMTVIWSSPTHKKTQSHRDAHTGSGRLTRPPAHWGTTMRGRAVKGLKMLTLFPTLCLQKSPPGPEWSLLLPLSAC